MPKGRIYSNDLRKAAIDLIEEGRRVPEVVKLLNVSRAALYCWLKRKKDKGNFEPKNDWRKGHGNKIKDLDKFREFVEANQNLTAKRMAEILGNITAKTVLKWLHRIGFTRKKRPMDTRNGVKISVSYIWMRSGI